MKTINHSNYESFYLDYLEGNLPEEQTNLLLQFLALYPELKVEEHETSPPLEASNEQFSAFEKMLLKKEIDSADLNEHSLSYFLIAHQEGELNKEQESYLENWISSNAAFQQEYALISKWKLQPDSQLVFSKKSALKQKESKIIPLFWTAGAVAAGVALFFTINLEPSTPSSQQKGWVQKTLSDSTQRIPLIDNPKKGIDGVERIAQTDYSSFNTTNLNKKKETVRFNKSGVVKNEAFLSDRIEQLDRKTIALSNETNLTILPRQFVLFNQVTLPPENNTSTNNSDLAWVSISDMSNPVAPITSTLSEKLNREIDFRRVKPTEKKAGGFFLKIGKFEILHKGGK